MLQNQRVHASNTSALADVVVDVRNRWNDWGFHRSNPNDAGQAPVLKAILDAYYAHFPQPIIFDKGRDWPAYIEMLELVLGRKVKLLVTVRDIPDVLTSLEELLRKGALLQSPLEKKAFAQCQTIAGRCALWMDGGGMVGLPYNRIKDAVDRGLKDRLHFVHYDRLTNHPQDTMDQIYEFIGEPVFDHDFENVEQVAQEDDRVYNLGPTLHKIRKAVRPNPSRAAEILGSVADQYSGLEFWK